METIKPVDYLKKIGIKISEDVEKEIVTSSDLDAVLDASYIYNTNYVDLDTFNKAQHYLEKYFNGELNYNDDNYVDLSLSLTATYCHYVAEEIPEDTKVVEVDLSNESRYYEVEE